MIREDQVPKPLNVSKDPFQDVQEDGTMRVWNRAWKEWYTHHKNQWKTETPIHTPDGPIVISSKTEREMGKVAPKEDARLHYIAATQLPDLLRNSVLVSVQPEVKGKADVAEVHRRYAWIDFPDGERRTVLLTVFRWSERIDKDFDTAYSEQVVLEVTKAPLEVTPDGNRVNGSSPASSGSATLEQFLSGVKAEHK